MIPLKTFNRRRILKGMLGTSAVTVALPFLDCFLDVNGTALADGQKLPVCFGTWFWGLGLNPGRWEPPTAGKITGFGSPATGHPGLAPSASGIDRRRISAAVLNCRALSVHGKTVNAPVAKWLDVFLIEPPFDRSNRLLNVLTTSASFTLSPVMVGCRISKKEGNAISHRARRSFIARDSASVFAKKNVFC